MARRLKRKMAALPQGARVNILLVQGHPDAIAVHFGTRNSERRVEGADEAPRKHWLAKLCKLGARSA